MTQGIQTEMRKNQSLKSTIRDNNKIKNYRDF